MRYVDRLKLVKPTGWSQRAHTATQAVANGEDPNDHSQVWRDLKDGLAALLHDKCWYCETPMDRSDNAVDHFRPKNRVADAANPHAGYRWLAFDESNFRYACTYCNSRRIDQEGGTAGGKADRFPLVNEAQRGTWLGHWWRSNQCCSIPVKFLTGAYSAVTKRMANPAPLALILSPRDGQKNPSRFTTCITSRHASDAIPQPFS